MATLPYAAVGTCMRNRKNLPKFQSKLEREESEIFLCKEGISACCWKDTKDVIVVSNWHGNYESEISRKMRNGQKKDVPCPESIILYITNLWVEWITLIKW